MPPLTPVGPVAAGWHRSALQARAAGSTGQALPHVARVVCRSSSLSARPPSQPARHPPTHPALPPSHPARHAPIPPHTCADRAASRGCSLRLLSAVWPDSNARAIPTAQGLGLIPQLLWVARFSAVRHLTSRTPCRTPSSAAPRTAHRAAHPWRFVHNPRLPPSAASISCRSQSDAHSEPPDAEPYGPCAPAHGRGGVDVLCLSAHSPPPKHLPAVAN